MIRLLSLIVIAAAAAGILNASPALADNMIEIAPVRAGHGITASIGQCPCFRWTIAVQGLGGKIDTKEVLISTDALIKFAQSSSADLGQLGSRITTIGAIDALIKEGHVGVGFKGISFGQDRDRGFSEILRTGFYALVNLIQNDATRLDIRGGYDFDRYRTVTGQEGDRHIVQAEGVFQVNSGPWRAQLDAHIGMMPNRIFSGNSIRAGGGASGRVRIASFSEFELGLAAELRGEYDSFREILGFDKSFNGTGMIMMDLAFVHRDMSND
jgi:hypothetical protein